MLCVIENGEASYYDYSYEELRIFLGFLNFSILFICSTNMYLEPFIPSKNFLEGWPIRIQ